MSPPVQELPIAHKLTAGDCHGRKRPRNDKRVIPMSLRGAQRRGSAAVRDEGALRMRRTPCGCNLVQDPPATNRFTIHYSLFTIHYSPFTIHYFSYAFASGKLAAATDCPTRRVFSSGSITHTFSASAGYSSRIIFRQVSKIMLPPTPDITRPRTIM